MAHRNRTVNKAILVTLPPAPSPGAKPMMSGV